MSEKKLNLVELANESLVKDLSAALTADPEVLRRIAQKVNTRNGFQVRDEDAVEVVRIWVESGLPSEKLDDALGVLKHIFKRAVDEDVPTDTVLDEIQALCEAKGISGFESRAAALRELLTPRPLFLERKKCAPFALGVERNLEGVSGVVELRGVFKDRESDEVIGYVPVAILRLSCGYDSDAEEHNVRYTFQVTETGLEKLSRALDAYRKQLKALRKTLPDNLLCFEDIQDTEAEDEVSG